MNAIDDSNWVYLFSSNAQPEYITDVLEVLAAPRHFIHHFRYEERWVQQSLLQRLPDKAHAANNALKNKNVVVSYLFQVEIAPRKWEPKAVYPIRRGKAIDAYKVGGIFHLHFALEDYYKCNPPSQGGASRLQAAVQAALDRGGTSNREYAVLWKPFDIQPAPASEDADAFQTLVNAIPLDHFKTVRVNRPEKSYCAVFYQVYGLYHVAKPNLLTRVLRRKRPEQIPLKQDKTFHQAYYSLKESTRYGFLFSTYHTDTNPVLGLDPSVTLDYDAGIFIKPASNHLRISSRYDSEFWPVITRSTTEELATALEFSSTIGQPAEASKFLQTRLMLPVRISPRFWHRRVWAIVDILGDIGTAGLALGIALNRIDQGASWLLLIILGAVLAVGAKIIPKLWRGV